MIGKSTVNHNQDPELQLSELRDYVIRRGWTITSEYVDYGISRSKESRPALDRLMADAQRRRFDILLVWKLDRFARSLKFLVVSLAELAALGVAFVSLRDNLDLSTPAGRFTAQLLGAKAEFEKELIRERVQAGLDRRKGDLHPHGGTHPIALFTSAKSLKHPSCQQARILTPRRRSRMPRG